MNLFYLKIHKKTEIYPFIGIMGDLSFLSFKSLFSIMNVISFGHNKSFFRKKERCALITGGKRT